MRIVLLTVTCCLRTSTAWTPGPAAFPPCRLPPGLTRLRPAPPPCRGSYTTQAVAANSSTRPWSWWTKPVAPASRCGATPPPASPPAPDRAGTLAGRVRPSPASVCRPPTKALSTRGAQTVWWSLWVLRCSTCMINITFFFLNLCGVFFLRCFQL